MNAEQQFRGNVAYDAYCNSVGGKSAITGDPLPEWGYLPETVKVAWCEAADAVWQLQFDTD